MEDGHVVVDSIAEITEDTLTDRLARESGFANVAELMAVARHGAGDRVFLVRFPLSAARRVGATPSGVLTNTS